MRKTKLLALGLAALMLTTSVGCQNIIPDLTGGAGEEVVTDDTTNEDTDEKEETKTSDAKTEFAAEQVGSLLANYYTMTEGGIYYKNSDEKYGVMTLDGNKGSGAIYDYAEQEEQYFAVVTTMPAESSDPTSINCFGLVDAEGNVLIPEQYASISVLNERFAQACEVTGITTSKDEALVYSSNNPYSITASDGDTLYKGVWYIYDLTTGEKVNGATGTNSQYCFAYGNYVKYYTDDGDQITVGADGAKIAEGADLFDDGSYAVTEDNTGAVYDADNNKLFSFKYEDYVPSYRTGDYFIASKYKDGTTYYVLLDESGKVVSAEFDKYITVYGNLIEADGGIYDFDGNEVISGTYDSVYIDDITKDYWMLKSGDVYTMINEAGEVLFKETYDDDHYINSSYFTASKDAEGSDLYYSFKDNDYTIAGYSMAPWLVEVESANFIYYLVNTLTGETIIDGYGDYKYVLSTDGQMYIYAEQADNEYDIYIVE